MCCIEGKEGLKDIHCIAQNEFELSIFFKEVLLVVKNKADLYSGINNKNQNLSL